MKNVLIIGGAGFIGYPLSCELTRHGYNVYIYDNFSNPNREYAEIGTVYRGDISSDTQKLSEVMNLCKPNVVINLAAIHYIPICNEDPVRTRAVNITGIKNILESIKKISPKAHFIFSSSAAVYRPSNNAHTETSELLPIDIYGETKFEAENIIKKYYDDFGTEYTILRLFNVYGDGDNTPHLIPEILKQIKKGDEINLGNTETRRDYIFIDDIISGFIAVISQKETAKNEIFNLGTGKSFSAKEIIESIRHYTKRDIKISRSTDMMRSNDRPMLLADITKIKNYIKWSPVYEFSMALNILLKKERLW